MLPEEQTVRTVLEMWAEGLDGILESFRRHCHADLVWWNSARGSISGLDTCLRGIEVLNLQLKVAKTLVPIKSLMAEPSLVFVERSDDLYRADGSLVVSVPVVGVLGFRGDKIISWRDYCDDWMREYRDPDSGRSLV